MAGEGLHHCEIGAAWRKPPLLALALRKPASLWNKRALCLPSS